MSGFSLASPWLLLLLPATLVLTGLPYLWKRRMGPVGIRYADTRLVSGNSRPLRLRLMPIVSILRFLALALVIVAVARPQIGDSREVIRGEGVDIVIALDISGSMGETDFEPKPVGGGEEHRLRIYRGTAVRPHWPRRIPHGMHSSRVLPPLTIES